MNGDDLAIIVPVWKRTTNLQRLADSVVRTVPGAELWLMVNADDVDVHEPVDTLRRDLFGSLVTAMWPVDWPGGSNGDYARKINAGYRVSDRPLLFTGADDIEFTNGWYEAACARMTLVPDPSTNLAKGNAIGVVGTVDGCNERTMIGTLSTHSLVARWYADLGGCLDQDRCIYHEGYPHEYVDDELVATAMFRSAYAHAFDSVVQHHHPNAGRAVMDETYARGRSRTRHSRRLFNQRRHLWLGQVRRGR